MHNPPETRTAGAEPEPAGPKEPAERQPEWDSEHEAFRDGEPPNFSPCAQSDLF